MFVRVCIPAVAGCASRVWLALAYASLCAHALSLHAGTCCRGCRGCLAGLARPHTLAGRGGRAVCVCVCGGGLRLYVCITDMYMDITDMYM